MTVTTDIRFQKMRVITGRENILSVELCTADGQPASDTHTVRGSLVNTDVDLRLLGPVEFKRDPIDIFVWRAIVPRAVIDGGLLVNPEAPDTRLVQDIARGRNLCYLQLLVAGDAINDVYLIDTHIQKGFS